MYERSLHSNFEPSVSVQSFALVGRVMTRLAMSMTLFAHIFLLMASSIAARQLFWSSRVGCPQQVSKGSTSYHVCQWSHSLTYWFLPKKWTAAQMMPMPLNCTPLILFRAIEVSCATQDLHGQLSSQAGIVNSHQTTSAWTMPSDLVFTFFPTSLGGI